MDRSVSGSVTTSGVAGAAAHIHLAAPGQNGPVIVPLNKTGDNVWSVPPAIRLNDAQYEAYRLGNLYVNVHSAANPAGKFAAKSSPDPPQSSAIRPCPLSPLSSVGGEGTRGEVVAKSASGL